MYHTQTSSSHRADRQTNRHADKQKDTQTLQKHYLHVGNKHCASQGMTINAKSRQFIKSRRVKVIKNTLIDTIIKIIFIQASLKTVMGQ